MRDSLQGCALCVEAVSVFGGVINQYSIVGEGVTNRKQ